MIHICGSVGKSTITGVEEGDIQPNAVDVRLDKVFRILPTVFILDEKTKTPRKTELVRPSIHGYYELTPGRYEVVMKNIVTIAEGEAGWVIPRSSVVRAGIQISTGLYDSGYSGMIVCCVHVYCNWLVRQGTRIAQFALDWAETLHLYHGTYGINENGVYKESDQKYL